MTISRTIGVLGTEATVRQPYVDDLAQRFAAGCTVVRHGSAELVAIAEAKLAGRPVIPDAIRAAAAPLFDREGKDIDVVVLACTHFPLLKDELAQIFPGRQWIDGGPGIARRIEYLTRGQEWPGDYPGGIALFTGGTPDPEVAEALRSYGLGEVRSL
jgi:glutamate racemase